MEGAPFSYGRPAWNGSFGEPFRCQTPTASSLFFFFFFVLATLEVAVFVSQEEAGVRSESKCSYKCREGRSPEPPAPRSDSISGFGFGSERLFLSGLHSLSVS